MRKVTIALLAGATFLAFGAAASAQTSTTTTTTTTATPATTAAPATTTTTTTASADPNEVVCKAMAAPTGTRLGSRRICHTNAQWDDIRRQDEQNTAQMQNNGFKNGVAGN